MDIDGMEGIKGWLLVYLIGSIPLLAFYSMGLSGWFFDYPLALMVFIFLILASPLVLVLFKSPQAPQWNIAVLWLIVVLMTLRSLSVVLSPMAGEQPAWSGRELLGLVAVLSGIVTVSLGWAIVWTLYFKSSVRVRNTFS